MNLTGLRSQHHHIIRKIWMKDTIERVWNFCPEIVKVFTIRRLEYVRQLKLRIKIVKISVPDESAVQNRQATL